MDGQSEVLKLLSCEFNRIKLKNSSYSLRSFARRLKVSPASLSGIMNGKLNLTKSMGTKVLEQIGARPDQTSQILATLKNKNQRKVNDLVPVDMDAYHLISDWYYFGILVLADTVNFKSSSKWIAKRLNIQIRQAHSALLTLCRLGLLNRNSKGKYFSTGKQFKTSSGVPNGLLRGSHFQNLDLARRSLEKDGLNECDFTAMTVAIDPKKIPEAKQMLTEFRRAFANRFEVGNKTEVFRLCLQFFPLTEINN